MVDALVQLHKPHRRECCLDRTWAAEHWAEGVAVVHLQNHLPSNQSPVGPKECSAAAPNQQT